MGHGLSTRVRRAARVACASTARTRAGAERPLGDDHVQREAASHAYSKHSN